MGGWINIFLLDGIAHLSARKNLFMSFYQKSAQFTADFFNGVREKRVDSQTERGANSRPNYNFILRDNVLQYPIFKHVKIQDVIHIIKGFLERPEGAPPARAVCDPD